MRIQFDVHVILYLDFQIPRGMYLYLGIQNIQSSNSTVSIPLSFFPSRCRIGSEMHGIPPDRLDHIDDTGD